MADQVKTAVSTTPDVLERAKGFWAANSRLIIIIGSVIIVGLAAYLGYKYLYKAPREEKANDQIFPAEKLFAKMASIGSYNKDSVNLVLNGGNLGGVALTGMLKIISNFDGTASANRAHYIAGACYLQIKDFDKAIKQLKDFDGNGADQVQSKAYILLGDAYSEKKNTDEALSYYKKAGTVLSDKDAAQKVVAMFTAASYADYLGKSKEAIDILNDIKENHLDGLVKKDMNGPDPAITVDDVDKLLAKLGVTK
jgi:predicted negative regulator of RcsB-dependent stress response